MRLPAWLNGDMAEPAKMERKAPARSAGTEAPGALKIVTILAAWALALGMVAVLIWLGVINVLLLIFFGILFGILLRALADGVSKKTRLNANWSLAVVVTLLVA